MGETDNPARRGLEILYAKPGPKDAVADVAERDLTKELRERYWIRQAADAWVDDSTWASFAMRWPLERAELGRSRNEPGDGFRYVFRGGLEEMGGRAEWFEVTEVFGSVGAKDIEAFMRLENGGVGYPGFDPARFVRELNLGLPSRAAQRRVADSVIAAVEKKLGLPSYEGLCRTHGYGTLIVGLPLWFAAYPRNPLRVENVIDDFMTRVLLGLESHRRQLRKSGRPFRRIVVAWNPSAESMREWVRTARIDIYRDPAHRRMRARTHLDVSALPGLLELVERAESGLPAMSISMNVARKEKREKRHHFQLPTGVAEWAQSMDDYANSHPSSHWTRTNLAVRRRLFDLALFLGAYGFDGLRRWITARLSPRRWIALVVMRRRARKLYRASRFRRERGTER